MAQAISCATFARPDLHEPKDIWTAHATGLHKNLIDGERVGADGMENINPSDTDEVLGQYARASAGDAARRSQRAG